MNFSQDEFGSRVRKRTADTHANDHAILRADTSDTGPEILEISCFGKAQKTTMYSFLSSFSADTQMEEVLSDFESGAKRFQSCILKERRKTARTCVGSRRTLEIVSLKLMSVGEALGQKQAGSRHKHLQRVFLLLGHV
jgi:hypothetical protein